MSGSQPQFWLSPKKSFSVRKTQPPVRAAGHKSFIRNILPASIAFPRIYPYPFRSDDPNPNEVRILAERYKKNDEIYTCENRMRTQLRIPLAQQHHVGDVVLVDDGQSLSVRRPVEVGDRLGGEVSELVAGRSIERVNPQIVHAIFGDHIHGRGASGLQLYSRLQNVAGAEPPVQRPQARRSGRIALNACALQVSTGHAGAGIVDVRN